MLCYAREERKIAKTTFRLSCKIFDMISTNRSQYNRISSSNFEDYIMSILNSPIPIEISSNLCNLLRHRIYLGLVCFGEIVHHKI